MLTTSRASEANTGSFSMSASGPDFGPRLFGQDHRGAAGPDGAVATFHASCQRHHVGKPHTDLVATLLGVSGQGRFEHLVALRTFDCTSDYFGARHLMVLADFFRSVEGPVFAQQRLRFSLVPCLQELVLRDLHLDFDVSDAHRLRLRAGHASLLPAAVTVGGNEAFRYLFGALAGHPSLQRLDVSNNDIGPALLPALQSLVKQTPSLVDVVLSNSQLSTSEQAVVHAMCQLNQLRLDQRDGSAARQRVDDEWQRQQEAWLRRQLRTGEPLPPAGVSAPSAHVATVAGRPVLRYRLPKEDPCLLSPACLDVLRAAFMEPAVATLTVLQGRPVPRGVPGPLPSRPLPKDDRTRARLAQQLGESALLRCVREQVWHRPAKPPGRFAHLGATFRSTKEDHHAHILATQRRQWDVLVGQLVSAMTPSSYAVGAPLYRCGEEAYWLTFVPHADGAAAWVEVTSSAGDAASSSFGQTPPTAITAPPAVYTVRGGQFVGEDDLLGAPAHYVADKYAAAAVTATTKGNPVRTSSASVGGTATAEGEVIVWQIPRDVALFYLSVPFHALHKHAAHALKLFPTLQSTPPALLARVAYALQPVGVTAVELRDAQVDSAGEARDARVQATGSELAHHLYLLEEGEFYLGHGTSAGKWTEKCLDGGVVVMNAASLALDTVARREGGHAASVGASNTTTATHETPGAARGAHGEKLGKAAFERQYKETQRHQLSPPSSASPMHTNASTTGAEVNSTATAESPDAVLSLGGSSSHWKYYVISNEDFANLPPSVRLALTARYVQFDA